jgi:hypothetical protein
VFSANSFPQRAPILNVTGHIHEEKNCFVVDVFLTVCSQLFELSVIGSCREPALTPAGMELAVHPAQPPPTPIPDFLSSKLALEHPAKSA